MFIRYNPVAKYYEYSTDITRRGKGPWLILPIDYTQIYNLPPIPPPYVLPANVALKDAFNTFTNLNYFQGRIILFSGAPGLGYNESAIEVQRVANPRISFHWPGIVASQIGMDSNGVIRTWDNPGTSYEHFAARNITANGALTSLGGNINCGGNLHNTAGYVYPGQITNGGGYQGIWYLASHASYGLYTNTGLYSASSLYAAGNVVANQGFGFPAAQFSHSDPNVLDDYEEGSWAPVISSSGGGSGGTTGNGSYTKIGNVVTYTFDANLSAYAFVEGYASMNLPFVASGYYGISEVSYFTITNPVSWFGILIDYNAASCSFRFIGGGGGSGTGMLYVGNIGPGGRIIGGGTYRTPT